MSPCGTCGSTSATATPPLWARSEPPPTCRTSTAPTARSRCESRGPTIPGSRSRPRPRSRSLNRGARRHDCGVASGHNRLERPSPSQRPSPGRHTPVVSRGAMGVRRRHHCNDHSPQATHTMAGQRTGVVTVRVRNQHLGPAAGRSRSRKPSPDSCGLLCGDSGEITSQRTESRRARCLPRRSSRRTRRARQEGSLGSGFGRHLCQVSAIS